MKFAVTITEIPNQYFERHEPVKVFYVEAPNATTAKQEALDRFGDFSKVTGCKELFGSESAPAPASLMPPLIALGGGVCAGLALVAAALDWPLVSQVGFTVAALGQALRGFLRV